MRNSNALKINDSLSEPSTLLIQAINGKKCKLLKTTKFVFLAGNNAKVVSKREWVYYHSVRLVEAKHGSYIEYYYRIPGDLQSKLPLAWIKNEWLYKGRLKEFGRFRVKEDINLKKNDEYTEKVLQAVKDSLEIHKYDPFQHLIDKYQMKVVEQAAAVKEEAAKRPILTVSSAFEIFLKAYVKDSPTYNSHMVIRSLLIEGLGESFDQDIRTVTANDLQSILLEMFEEKEWSKSTFNDKVKKLRTFYGAITKKELIPIDISKKLEMKTKVGKTKNTPFDDKTAVLVKELMLNHPLQPSGRQVHEFCEVVYYTCTRPDKETRQLKCKDILWERGLIYIDPERAKGGAGGHIPMCAELRELLIKMGVDKAPAECYIFGTDYKPGPECFKAAHFSWFFREKIVKPNNLDPELVCYSWKPTRVIHLHKDGANPYDIQQLCRHESLTQTMDYMRDLGLVVTQETNQKTRRF